MSKIKYSKEFLEPLVKESFSTQEVMRKLGLKLTGGNNSHLKKKFISYGLDISHFYLHGSNFGPNHKGGNSKISFDRVLVFDRHKGRRENVFRLKRAMLEAGFEHKCEQCGLPPIWNGKPITLQIDHRDGNGLNNLKENLRFICPNCHSQTENYGAKNIAKCEHNWVMDGHNAGDPICSKCFKRE